MRSHKPKQPKLINVQMPDTTPIRKAPKVKFEELEPAIIEGKLQCETGTSMILRKDHLNDKTLYLCRLMTVHENGDVILRNETTGQDVVFNLKNPMSLKILIDK